MKDKPFKVPNTKVDKIVGSFYLSTEARAQLNRLAKAHGASASATLDALLRGLDEGYFTPENK